MGTLSKHLDYILASVKSILWKDHGVILCLLCEIITLDHMSTNSWRWFITWYALTLDGSSLHILERSILEEIRYQDDRLCQKFMGTSLSLIFLAWIFVRGIGYLIWDSNLFVDQIFFSFCHVAEKMKKGIHPQLQWISYVTQTGRLINVMMTRLHRVGRVYQLRARRQMAPTLSQVAKFNLRYGLKNEENTEK